jgi:uncharacterized protein YodC (DUF2158 family)
MVTATTAFTKPATANVPTDPKRKPKHIKVGDSLRLNSGSNKMSITAVRRDGIVICMWFDERQTVRRAASPPAALWLDQTEISCEVVR